MAYIRGEVVTLEEAKEQGKIERQEAAKQLRLARSRLKLIQREYERISRSCAGIVRNASSITGCLYPDVPPPQLQPDRYGAGLPTASGIYFFWQADKVVYVGQSINLFFRVRLTLHHALKEGHRISYLLIPKEELNWAECYYIGILRTPLNFGKKSALYEGSNAKAH